MILDATKKPEAVLFDGTFYSYTVIRDLSDKSIVSYNETEVINGNRLPPFLTIETLEGVMTASVGDYVIRGVQGELYPCKPDIFEKTYEYKPSCSSE